MKLLMISGDRSILQGKKGAFWYTLEELSKHWERVDVICPRDPGCGNRDSGNAKNVLGARSGKTSIPIPASRIPDPSFPNVFFHSSPHSLWYQPFWILKKGGELLMQHRHNVMTVHEYPPFYNGLGGLRLARKTDLPCVLELHHLVGWPHAASFVEWVGKWLSRLWLPFACRRASVVRCVSRETVDRLQQWGVPQEKLHIVPSFYLDADALRFDASISKKYDVVAAGRLVANKRFDCLLRAMAKMPERKLLLIGDGPLRFKLEHLARQLNITDRVTFAGWLPSNAEVYRALQSAQIFVLPSQSEGGPRVALEAMALGLPVISTRVGVMREVIRDGENGIFTDGGLEDLTEKIEKLLLYAELQSRIGTEARNILGRFERGKLIAEYAAFLQNQERA